MSRVSITNKPIKHLIEIIMYKYKIVIKLPNKFNKISLLLCMYENLFFRICEGVGESYYLIGKIP